MSIDNWWLITSVMKPANPGSPPALLHTWCEPNTPPFVYMQRQSPANCCITCYLMLLPSWVACCVYVLFTQKALSLSANTRLTRDRLLERIKGFLCLVSNSSFKSILSWIIFTYTHHVVGTWPHLSWGKVWFHLIPWKTGWSGFWTGLCVLICTCGLV